jgi:hypothetical protein
VFLRNFLVFLSIFLLATPAEAHSPYAERMAILKSPTGSTLIAEELYGDGIFSADPVTFEIRNTHGAVIASSPVGDHMQSWCFSIENCFAFPYRYLSVYAKAWKVDFKNLEYDKPNTIRGSKEHSEEDKEFQRYVSGTGPKVIRNYQLTYPDLGNKYSGFIEAPIWVTALSPLFIVKGQIVSLALLFALCFCPLAMSKNKAPEHEKKNAGTKIFEAGLGILASGFLALVFMLILFTVTTPITYAAVTMLLGLWFGKRYQGRSRR